MSIKFYSVQLKEEVSVDASEVEVVTMKNGKKAAKAQVKKGGKLLKLYKILGKEDLKKLEK